ncbi:group II truncated hemoglobin [Pseudomonas stutzeri]|nr:group II truncated hemoglobin [Stutzerimonas stutzeri]
MNHTPYQLLGGEDGVRRLCDAFYDCMDSLPEAADIRRMHGEDLAGIRQKLFEFLSGWLGGPPLYAQKYGSICMSGPHRPYAIGPKERDQWLLCMDRALERIGAGDEVRTMLERPMYAIADMIRNREASAPT